MRVLITLMGIISFAMVADQATSQTIGIFADPEGTSTNISLTPGVEGTCYILATAEGTAAEGFLVVEFRVAGLPASWTATADPNPEALSFLGDPFGIPGAVIGFIDCQTVEAGYALLYTVTLVSTEAVPNATLSVVMYEPPSDPDLPCPAMAFCNPQVFEPMCAIGGQATIEVEEEIVNDTCEDAFEIPWCSTYTNSGDTTYFVDDYTPSNQIDGDGCTGRWAPGPDSVYKMHLVPGLVVHATYTQTTSDGSLYVITDCSDPQGSCVVGVDETGWGEMEILDWTADTEGDYYLICDAWDPAGGPYTLDVQIDCSVAAENATWGGVKGLYR